MPEKLSFRMLKNPQTKSTKGLLDVFRSIEGPYPLIMHEYHKISRYSLSSREVELK